MKIIFLFLAILISGCDRDKAMNLHVLGNDEFSKEKWSTASQRQRGKMVASFIDSHEVTSMTASELRSLLGESTAYYEYDEFPAYFIGSKSTEEDDNNSYVFAFPIDRKTGRIRKYVIEPPIK